MTFATKDSGERVEFSTGMRRDVSAGKLRPDLCYMPMFVRWAELMGRGAEKYGERNWEKAETAEELARFKESAFRHFIQWYLGLNPEEDHAAAVFFNVSGVEYVKGKLDAERLREAMAVQLAAISRAVSRVTIFVVRDPDHKIVRTYDDLDAAAESLSPGEYVAVMFNRPSPAYDIPAAPWPFDLSDEELDELDDGPTTDPFPPRSGAV